MSNAPLNGEITASIRLHASCIKAGGVVLQDAACQGHPKIPTNPNPGSKSGAVASKSALFQV
jgi:hypothetical protein